MIFVHPSPVTTKGYMMEDDLYTARPGKFCKIRMLFLVAALYNIGLAIFFFITNKLGADLSLALVAVTMLLVFGVMFCNLAMNPVRYKKLIPYAILRNLAYCGLAGWFFYKAKLPLVWLIPGAVDAFFLLFFIIVWIRLFNEEDDV